MKRIIARADTARNHIIFDLDTLDNERETIKVWRNTGSATMDTATIEYYRTTLPLSDSEETAIVRKYTDVFKLSEGVILRRRLYKEQPVKNGTATAIGLPKAATEHIEIVPHAQEPSTPPSLLTLTAGDHEAIAKIVIAAMKAAIASM